MRPVLCVYAFLASCSGGTTGRPLVPDDPTSHTSVLADEDRYVPTYSKAELERALIAERGAEASAERVVAQLEAKDRTAADDDRYRVVAADLRVRRRFIQSLELCQSDGRWCPPRLDDPSFAFDVDSDRPAGPPIDAALRFDLDGWRAIAGELHGRACACRTLHCVDAVSVALAQLEQRPDANARGDELASLAVTRARECLYRLRGVNVHVRAPRAEAAPASP